MATRSSSFTFPVRVSRRSGSLSAGARRLGPSFISWICLKKSVNLRGKHCEVVYLSNVQCQASNVTCLACLWFGKMQDYIAHEKLQNSTFSGVSLL